MFLGQLTYPGSIPVVCLAWNCLLVFLNGSTCIWRLYSAVSTIIMHRWSILHHLMVGYSPFQLVATIWPREQKKRHVFISSLHCRVGLCACYISLLYKHGAACMVRLSGVCLRSVRCSETLFWWTLSMAFRLFCNGTSPEMKFLCLYIDRLDSR